MYKDKTTTQMAARFLRHAGNRLPYIVLLKMLYLADRKMLLEHGEPITFDKWVSMQNGPLLSEVYDQIKSPERSQFWSSHINTVGYDVLLSSDPGDGALSELEEEVIDTVFEKYKDVTGRYEDDYIWRLVELTHELPEWDRARGLYGGVSDIPYEKVLRLAGVPEDTIEAIVSNIDGYSLPSVIAEVS